MEAKGEDVRIALDFDGSIVEQDGHPYADVVSPLVFLPGAREGLQALRRAHHTLLLWSSRASRSLLFDPHLDPLVRAGAVQVDRRQWQRSRGLHRQRYDQMVEFVEAELPGIFDAIDDGLAGKPTVDKFIDDKAGPVDWFEIASQYGDLNLQHPMPAEPSLLDRPVASLNLVPTGRLRDIIDEVRGELQEVGIQQFEPAFYLGDSDLWTADRAVSINIPWFLANEELHQLAMPKFPFSWDDVARDLRHEVGHAVNYGFKLYTRLDWEETFGDFDLPYPADGEWRADPAKARDFPSYLRNVHHGYGQRHPDEAWAETFGAWLDQHTDADALMAGLSPLGIDKVRYVDRIAHEVLSGPAVNYDLGQQRPYRMIVGTVGSVLGVVTPGETPAVEKR